MSNNITPPTDLTRRPPRSPRVRLGGYDILPRVIDKGRAVTAGTNGEYNFDCPVDHLFFSFVGITGPEFKKQIDAGHSDAELLEWIKQHASFKRSPQEIAAWNLYVENRIPTDLESREYFQELHKSTAPHRSDIGTWFELLDLDDSASFGGNP